jgi:hypothetical protein
MTTETAKVKSSLSSLSNSLDELETELEPLFAQSLPEFIINLDKIQQAKLQTVLPYLICDLIFSASMGQNKWFMKIDVCSQSTLNQEGSIPRPIPSSLN